MNNGNKINDNANNISNHSLFHKFIMINEILNKRNKKQTQI